MVSKKWSQKVVSGNCLKNGLENWFQKMVSKNGFKKWSQNVVSKNGLNKWSQQMVSKRSLRNGLKHWSQLVVSKNGLNKWSQKNVSTYGQQKSLKSDPRRTRNLFRSDPASIQNRTRVDPRPPRSDLGTPWRTPSGESSKVFLFEEKGHPKRTPFAVDFASFHYMEVTKRGFGGIATARAHVKKVAFSSGKY